MMSTGRIGSVPVGAGRARRGWAGPTRRPGRRAGRGRVGATRLQWWLTGGRSLDQYGYAPAVVLWGALTG